MPTVSGAVKDWADDRAMKREKRERAEFNFFISFNQTSIIGVDVFGMVSSGMAPGVSYCFSVANFHQ